MWPQNKKAFAVNTPSLRCLLDLPTNEYISWLVSRFKILMLKDWFKINFSMISSIMQLYTTSEPSNILFSFKLTIDLELVNLSASLSSISQ